MHGNDNLACIARLRPVCRCGWVVYAKRPFAGPDAVLADLSRDTHRVAIANSRLVSLGERGVTFRWRDCREKGSTRHKTMTLAADGFMRRVLLRGPPPRFHRIRHDGLLPNGNCKSGNPSGSSDPAAHDARRITNRLVQRAFVFSISM